jgi:acyl-CoA reductase-like NAD-dependent aldehyde dehydrogenase
MSDDRFAKLRAALAAYPYDGITGPSLHQACSPDVISTLLDAADERDRVEIERKRLFDMLGEKARDARDLHARAELAEAQRDRLAAVLEDAIECIEHWAAYAGDYFRNKHDLDGDLARFRTALAELEKPNG